MTQLQLIAIVSAVLAVGFTIPAAVTSMPTEFGWNSNWVQGWRFAAVGCAVVAVVTTALS
jgi:hypothetical protein